MKAPALLLSILLLAGCTSPLRQARSDDLFIDIVGEPGSAFQLGVPLPIDPITGLGDWADQLRLSEGNATWSIEPSEHGALLVVRGSGFVSIEGLFRREPEAGADSFIDGHWTTQEGVRPFSALPMRLDVGAVHQVTLRYSATSCNGSDCAEGDTARNQICSLVADATRTDPEPGWSELEVRTDDWTCTRAPA